MIAAKQALAGAGEVGPVLGRGARGGEGVQAPSRAHQELDPEDHIVVVCHHGVRSMNVTAWLRQQGFEKAQSMRGGIDAWSRRVDGTLPTY